MATIDLTCLLVVLSLTKFNHCPVLAKNFELNYKLNN